MYYFTRSNNVTGIPNCIITKIKLHSNIINFNGSMDKKLGKMSLLKYDMSLPKYDP